MPRRKSKALQGSGIQQMLNATKGPMTRIKKKRTRVLRLPDPIDNPFCSDRQIEDIYHEMTAKPKMIQDLDIKPPPMDPLHILPSSVFAPHKDLLQRRWAGQKISDVPDGLSHMIGSAMSHGVEQEDDVEAWQPPGQEEEREEYKPPEVEEKFVRRVPKVDARVITFGHRPSSASRHFDPLTLNTSTVQYKKKGKKIPRVGLLSSSDLHKMLGLAAARYRYQKEFEDEEDEASSVIYNSNDNMNDNNNNSSKLNQSQSTPALNSNSNNNNNNMSSSNSNMAPPMQTPKIDGSSQQMSLAIGVSTPIVNNNNSINEINNNTSSGMFNSTTKNLVNPNEFEAIKAPAWLGGVYAVGGGRSLFNNRKEDKGFKIQLEKDNDDGKWDNKIYYPPPQRAFKSALMEDEVSSTSTKQKISKYTKLSAGAIITPVCEERQFTDMLEARDVESRIMKSANTNKSVRVYQKNGVISSLTPRKTFSHDINEIQRTIKRKYGDNIWDVEDEEGEEEENSDEEEEDYDVEGNEFNDQMMNSSIKSLEEESSTNTF